MERSLLASLALVIFLVSGCLGGVSKADSNDKVLVEFYSESLCPFCANFVVNDLSKFFENGLIDLVELRIIPYGNARMFNGGDIVCQHGPDECNLNVIQTCAINHYRNVTQWFPFILCLETLAWELPRSLVYSNWKYCVVPSGLELEPIETCFEGPLGDKLERDFAAETDSLDPPHKYVPWVVVNGTPLYEEYEDIHKVVCDAYKGPLPKPDACKEVYSTGKAHNTRVCTKGQIELGASSQAGNAAV